MLDILLDIIEVFMFDIRYAKNFEILPNTTRNLT